MSEFTLEEVPGFEDETAESSANKVEENEPALLPADGQTENDPLKEERHRLISESLQAGGMNTDDIPVVSDWVTMMIGDQTGKWAIYQAMLTSFGRKHGLELYAIIREAMEKLNLPGENCFAKRRKT